MTPFIVAEMSANHLGSFQRALRIIEAAAEAGADAIKFQTWSPDTMCVDPSYTLDSGPWAGRRLMDLYREAWTPWEWHRPMFYHARQHGLIPFSAAFDCESVDFLETLGVDRHKVASFELVDLPLIRYMASKGKPMILSTGMATSAEVTAAYRAAHAAFNPHPAAQVHQRLPGRCVGGQPVDARRIARDPLGPVRPHARHRRRRGRRSPRRSTSRSTSPCPAQTAVPTPASAWSPHEFKQMVTECRRAAAAVGTATTARRPASPRTCAARCGWSGT
jgi:sialic acid synthase SpsE